MNGPLRSTATDATTTIVAVIAILRASPYQNSGSGSIRREQPRAVGWAEAHSELARHLSLPRAPCPRGRRASVRQARGHASLCPPYALRDGSFSTAVELHLDRRAALDRLVDDAIALGQL